MPISRNHLEILFVLSLAIAFRTYFIAILPPEAYALDLSRWQDVTNALTQGQNPYVATQRLNYLPLWLQSLYVVTLVSEWTNATVHHVIQCLLMICDILLLSLLWWIGKRFIVNNQLVVALLFGFAINPAAVILTVQHGNFDVLFMIFVVCALDRLYHAYRNESPEQINWLLACLFLGIGILAKTVPIVLIPLLFLGARYFERRVLLLGGVLVLGPAFLGLSVIFSIAPAATAENVLQYRGMPGYFGFSGALFFVNQLEILNAYIQIFPLVLFGLLGVFCWFFYSNRLRLPTFRDQVVFSTLAFMFVPVFGSGYGPQYIMWFLPLLPLVLSGAHRHLKVAIWTFWGICLATFAVEYALLPSHGAFAITWMGRTDLIPIALFLFKRTNQFLLRLPLFVCCLFLFVTLINDLRRANERIAVS